MNLNFVTNRCQNQSSVTENAVFVYTAIVQTGSQRINKQIHAASDTAKTIHTNMEALIESSGIKVKWVILSG